jgi:hypothetical protein
MCPENHVKRGTQRGTLIANEALEKFKAHRLKTVSIATVLLCHPHMVRRILCGVNRLITTAILTWSVT